MYDYSSLRNSSFWIGKNIQVIGPRNLLIINRHKKVRLQPRLTSVLTALAASGGQVVPRQQLIETLWADYYTGDLALNQTISKLRRALGDSSGNTEIIETVVKNGYRLLLPVYSKDPNKRFTYSSLSTGVRNFGWIASVVGLALYFVFSDKGKAEPVIYMNDPNGMVSEELQAKIQQLSENPESYEEVMAELKKVFPDSSFQVTNEGQSLMVVSK